MTPKKAIEILNLHKTGDFEGDPKICRGHSSQELKPWSASKT